jgi:biopolymer transport protein ExbD
MKVSLSDIGGTVILLLFFVALNPLITESLNILLPQLGATESLIARSIPLIILFVIASNLLQEDPDLRR